MEFEQLLLKVSEIFHESINSFREETLGKGELADLSKNLCYYLDAVNKLGNPSFTELANELNVTKASVTAAVNKLIRQNYVYKLQSHEDQRIFYLYLTDKGRKAVDHDKESHTNFATYIQKCLNQEEIEQLTKIFLKIINCYSDRKFKS